MAWKTISVELFDIKIINDGNPVDKLNAFSHDSDELRDEDNELVSESSELFQTSIALDPNHLNEIEMVFDKTNVDIVNNIIENLTMLFKEKISYIFSARNSPSSMPNYASRNLNMEHPTAEQVYDEVKQRYPTLGLSTVYNTLHILRDMDMVNELAFSDSKRFDPNTRIHINFVCENCGRIIDLIDHELKDIVEQISDKKRFSISGHRLDIYGKCRHCSK